MPALTLTKNSPAKPAKGRTGTYTASRFIQLDERMKAKGFTDTTLAVKLGPDVTARRVGDWRRKVNIPDPEMMQRLAAPDVLDCTLQYLYGEKPPLKNFPDDCDAAVEITAT